MVECAEAREAWKQKIFKEKAQNRYYCYATSVPTLMKIHPGRPNITHCYKTRISASKLNLICSSRKAPKIGVDVIPEQIWNPELSHLFSKLRIPWILEVLEMKSRILVKFGFSMYTPNKTRSSAFHWNNSRTSKIEGILSSEKICESSGLQNEIFLVICNHCEKCNKRY